MNDDLSCKLEGLITLLGFKVIYHAYFIYYNSHSMLLFRLFRSFVSFAAGFAIVV